MTILDKLFKNIYDIIMIIVEFLPIAVLVTLLKTVINLKGTTKKDFLDIIMEFIISIFLSCVVGYFSYYYFNLDIKIVIGLVAIVSWTGSKFKTIIDTFIDNKINNLKNLDKNGEQ